MADAIRHVTIRGRVQGVGFRYWTRRTAAARGLEGWVRNRRDGSVEALLIGGPEAIAAVVEACRNGPPLAQVSDIAESADADDGSLTFRQLPTV